MTDRTRNPFPGMNPWLEQFWGDIHTSLTTYTRDAVQSRLPPQMRAVVEEYLGVVDYDEDLADRGRVVPDVSMLDTRVATTKAGQGGSAVALATVPAENGVSVGYTIPIPEPPTLRRIEIIDVSTGRKLVTAIEFLSPFNKRSDRGIEQYRKKQSELMAGGVSLVEIDLLRAGQWVLVPDESAVPPPMRDPYRISVTRLRPRRETILYPAGFRTELPVIAIPLREADDDLVLPLQPILDTAYLNGRYGQEIDYAIPPYPRLEPYQQEQVAEIFERGGLLKEPNFSKD